MVPVLVKAYGAFHPAGQDCFEAIRRIGSTAVASADLSAISADTTCPWLLLERELLRISFEGLFFPTEDVLAALASALPAHTEGKLDILDLEAWTLTRHQWTQGSFRIAERGLNEVLDYSGH